MTEALIIDVVILAILAIFITVGASRGLFKSIMTMFSTLIAIGGSAYLAGNYSPLVTAKLFPAFKERIIEKVDLTEFIAKLSVETDISKPLGAGQIFDPRNYVNLNVDYEELLDKAAFAFLQGLVKVVMFIVGFVLLLILLNLLIKLLDNVFKLPVLKQFNRLGGGVLGFAEGVLLVCLVVYISGKLGITFFMDNAPDSTVLRLLTVYSPYDFVGLLK